MENRIKQLKNKLLNDLGLLMILLFVAFGVFVMLIVFYPVQYLCVMATVWFVKQFLSLKLF